MADLKAYLNQIETVDDYFKYKDAMSKNPPGLQVSKPLGSLADIYEDLRYKQLKEIPKQSQSEYDLPIYKGVDGMGMAKSQYIGDSNIFSYKENIIPKELKDDKNMNKLSNIKMFGNDATNESMVENSFIKQLNIKNFGFKNMFEIDKPKDTTNNIIQQQKPMISSELDKISMKTNTNNIYNPISKPATNFDYAGLSSKYTKSNAYTPKTSSNNTYNKFNIPERPDVNGQYIDNNDIRAYLNSLDSKLVVDSKSSISSKSRSISENPKKKQRNKNRKMDLSIIEDDMEGEEQENRPNETRKKTNKTKKQREEEISEDSYNDDYISKNKQNHRKKEKTRYEEDLTKNYSEKELSLYSASQFNDNYIGNKQKRRNFSEHSLPSKAKDQDYLKKKYGKTLPNEAEIMRFLDNISEVICMNCNELVDLLDVDQHSIECYKAVNGISNIEDTTSINHRLKQLVYLLKKKLKNIKEYINKHEESDEHFYFNYTLMIIECLNQIIGNDQNIAKLVSNIKDINAFNKSLYENDTPLSKFILSITYKIKPIAKLKIPCINKEMTWEQAKNFREKSIINQNYMKTETKSQVFRDSHRVYTGNMRESLGSGSRFISNNTSMMMRSNSGDVDDGIKKEFMQMIVNAKLSLDRNHPGRNCKGEEMYMDIKKMKLGKENWMEFIESRFKEIANNHID